MKKLVLISIFIASIFCIVYPEAVPLAGEDAPETGEIAYLGMEEGTLGLNEDRAAEYAEYLNLDSEFLCHRTL